jgi:hypothetical protein
MVGVKEEVVAGDDDVFLPSHLLHFCHPSQVSDVTIRAVDGGYVRAPFQMQPVSRAPTTNAITDIKTQSTLPLAPKFPCLQPS